MRARVCETVGVLSLSVKMEVKLGLGNGDLRGQHLEKERETSFDLGGVQAHFPVLGNYSK